MLLISSIIKKKIWKIIMIVNFVIKHLMLSSCTWTHIHWPAPRETIRQCNVSVCVCMREAIGQWNVCMCVHVHDKYIRYQKPLWSLRVIIPYTLNSFKQYSFILLRLELYLLCLMTRFILTRILFNVVTQFVDFCFQFEKKKH